MACNINFVLFFTLGRLAECYLDMETGCGVERKERRGWEVGGESPFDGCCNSSVGNWTSVESDGSRV